MTALSIILCLQSCNTNIQNSLNNTQDIINASNCLDASYVGLGNVSNTMYSFISGAKSNLHLQMDNINVTLLNKVDTSTLTTDHVDNNTLIGTLASYAATTSKYSNKQFVRGHKWNHYPY